MRKPSASPGAQGTSKQHVISLSKKHLSCYHTQCSNLFVVAVHITRPPPVCLLVRRTVRKGSRRSFKSAAPLAKGWKLKSHSRYTTDGILTRSCVCGIFRRTHSFAVCSLFTLHTLVTMMKISSCARVPRAALLPVDEKYNFVSTELPPSYASGCFSPLINLPRVLCPCSYGIQTSSQEQETS